MSARLGEAPPRKVRRWQGRIQNGAGNLEFQQKLRVREGMFISVEASQAQTQRFELFVGERTSAMSSDEIIQMLVQESDGFLQSEHFQDVRPLETQFKCHNVVRLYCKTGILALNKHAVMQFVT